MLRLEGQNEDFCIRANAVEKSKVVKLFPCSSKPRKKNLWSLDLNGRLISSRYPTHCLSPSSVMEGALRQIQLKPCSSAARFQSWFFTSTGEIRFEGSKQAIQVKESARQEDIYLGPRAEDETAYVTWKRIFK